jgi:hypothetical protein
MARRSLELIEAMHAAAKAAQPITGRGVGYKLFIAGFIPSMANNEMQRVYRLLRLAREQGDIPWEWIVDETRALERCSTWADPAEYARAVARSYRRDFWNQQPIRCEVWSEKGTVRGVLAPVLDHYAVGFRVMHGFSGATTVYDISQDDDGRELIAPYVGDLDPSGMFMSEEDLPARLSRYDGDHVELRRIALTRRQVDGLPSFPATDKRKDPRYRWFRANYGDRCWELDAMDPNDLRDCVEREIVKLIEPIAWQSCEIVNRAEQESLKTILEVGQGPMSRPDPRNVCDGCDLSLDRRLRTHVELGPVLHNHIWRQIAEPCEVLCLLCMGKRAVQRLGRHLALADLIPSRWNLWGQPHSWFDLFAELEGKPPSSLAEWRSVGDPGEFEPLNPPPGRGLEAQNEPYDAAVDFENSINDCYRAVRDRVAGGGEPWKPK